VTLPVTPGLSPYFLPPSPPASVTFPLDWLLQHAAPPIQFRALVEVARLPAPVSAEVSGLPFLYRPALQLMLRQSPDGTWNNAMLGVPSLRAEGFEGVGTIPAARRLLEYGWDRESPPLALARRLLFRLLAEDDDPAYLYELAPTRGRIDEETARRGRGTLREAAAAALAQAGYEGDPRLRGAARRIVERIATHLRSPLGKKPWIRVGNRQVLAADAAPPSLHVLVMLAHMPLFRSENHEWMDWLYEHLTQPLPRQEAMQLVGKRIVPQPHLVLGDLVPHRNAVDADVPFALVWLELMARLGFLRRNENWSKMFERFLEDRDPQGVWHPHKGMAAPRTTHPFVWPSYPLESGHAGEERWTDVTFRLGVIAGASGRPIELI
jgi:hypothetical protein